jgi:agmatinase
MTLRFTEKTFISARATFREGRTVLLGCPFDGTASFRPGARFGPEALRNASWGIETYSPYQNTDLERLAVHDMGDLELPLGEKRIALRSIRNGIRRILDRGKFSVLLGGEHLISLPAVEEVLTRYPDLHVVQFDAHTDLREDYLGEALSHSTVMRKLLGPLGEGRLSQIGIRSGTEAEFSLAKKIKSIVPPGRAAVKALAKRLRNRPVYVSLDLDVIDPGFLPGVGTPEPGGLSFRELLDLLLDLRGLSIVGFDLVELTPDYDPTGVSAVTASVLLREMLLAYAPR